MNQCYMENGLYDPSFEHDNCGIGAVVDIKGRRSHKIVADALSILENLEHRAGKDAEGKSGDGAGILTQISHRFFSKVCKELGIAIGKEREYGIGVFFFSQEETVRLEEMHLFEKLAASEGLKFLGWRKVVTDDTVLGSKARACKPEIYQGFIEKPENVPVGIEFDRKLYLLRRRFEHSDATAYIPSLSSRTIVYKGMFLVHQVRGFFLDLQDEDYESAIATVHSRFSTNTAPSWERAHPNRLIVHNGEINTIKGNAGKMLAREETMISSVLKKQELAKALPVIRASGSDSAMFDNALEFLMMNGMELPLAAMILIPEPWSHNDTISQEERDFYQYYATMMEPWDGPASIMFTDGDVLGAILDRNGLRPSRYYITDDDRLILASEVGVLDIEESHVVRRERLHPGKLLLVDTRTGKVQTDQEVKQKYAKNQPYGEWLDSNLLLLKNIKIPNAKVPSFTEEQRTRLQKAVGYTREEYQESIFYMAFHGIEKIGAMGVDTPIAVLSKEYQPLFYYFKQLFAQVTNPPIDAVREEIVTSTTVYVGKHGNVLNEQPENCQMLKIENPILTDLDLLKICTINSQGWNVVKVSTTYEKGTPIEEVLQQLFTKVDKAYEEGATILVLSDRGIDEAHVALPSLLAVAAVHNHLVETKRCTAMSLIIESAEPREVHHFATLLGYGASAVNPYLAHATIAELIEKGVLNKDYYAAVEDYDHAILQGIVKIASKMGISTIQSYQGSKIFEAIGINKEVIGQYFSGTVSRIGGIGLKEIQMASEEQHTKAYAEEKPQLLLMGRHKQKKEGEIHRCNIEAIRLLQQATREGDYEKFIAYTKLVDEEKNGELRSLMEFSYPEQGIDISEVESVETIVKRFKTGAMSYGSISEEAHKALAIAMNHLHAKSNSGEGGESEERLETANTENDSCSKIKQVASGRFGVTTNYLVSAKEIQIKMAQGAKPGEGGHLPGKKVYPWVAKTRHSTPGVSLISPPPHHDIYSIEDLAQLIYDLKNVNPQADISVKLVSEAGVGTVAAGVAKAGASVILISGYDGGTGAAPLSSIHNAGLPWELGVAEAHQTLIMNGLRDRVMLETDGKLMSGRDVAVAAILGAEEFGFATAPLITLGCDMLRVCNLDTCPMGIATQNPELRKRFTGKAEYVENFMLFVAEQLREYMARLGVRTVNELVGRTDLLKKKKDLSGNASLIDLSNILLRDPQLSGNHAVYHADKAYEFHLDTVKDEQLLKGELSDAVMHGTSKTVSVTLTNTDRTFGTRIGSELTKRYPKGLEEDTITIHCHGVGGQSFGAFLPKGMTVTLCGDCNDYLGKGLSGGKLVVYAPENKRCQPKDNILIGNVAFYGATSGTAYIAGRAGERFCVRNSGITAVVEGLGEHGCEYMTGGKVVVLGSVHKNFAAGMSGGVAYVLDEKNQLYRNLNKELVRMDKVEDFEEQEDLRRIITEHVKATNSIKGKEVLEHFSEYLPKFKKIIPEAYQAVVQLMKGYMEQGMSVEDAQIEAFYDCTGQKKNRGDKVCAQ